ncbi:MAG: YdeI/OmpD-associated family protein [Frankiaceae bacterium]|nr:YdeI/OmpD-associated family protein [Frankiaceae bacterium]MBV9870588.1 YdeI/OmpD-associated family protein [Frankiaceae bacterium]
MDEPIFFASPEDWRAWLSEHHATATECLVGFVKVTTGEAGMTWSESVDQALCFGWIDGVRRRLDDRSYTIRFTRRKPGSNWSAINVKKVADLETAGLMTDAGRAAFERRSEKRTAIYAYEKAAEAFAPEEAAEFEARQEAWRFFTDQAPWYQRNATHWVVSAKREETRRRRFKQLIEDSAAGQRLRQYRY